MFKSMWRVVSRNEAEGKTFFVHDAVAQAAVHEEEHYNLNGNDINSRWTCIRGQRARSRGSWTN